MKNAKIQNSGSVRLNYSPLPICRPKISFLSLTVKAVPRLHTFGVIEWSPEPCGIPSFGWW